jgi:transposase
VFPVYGVKCLSRKAVHNWIEKFSQRRLKVADDAQPGCPVETATEAAVQRVGEMIRADRKITIDSVATALRCPHGLAYSILHDLLKFRELCARWMPRELKDREKIRQTGLSLQHLLRYAEEGEPICLTGLLLWTNHGCITTGPNQSVLQCNGNIPVTFNQKLEV